MEYVLQWLTPESWDEEGILDLDAGAVASAGEWPQPVREALEVARTYGLPNEVYGMFYPSEQGAAFTRVTPKAGEGPYWRLGRHESSHALEYVLDEEGRVVIPDPSLPEPRFVNSSLLAFLDALAAWDHRSEHLDDFDDLEPDDPEEEDDPAEAARVAFGLKIRDGLRAQDPDAFRDDIATWWQRVYEEVELDAI
ncbi:SUKH-4 family immunity protein [Streptomyces atratus]|uniref:SUKH-4 family immunity protein n=1 Tax=Streptomyces atratus TaxID=1893 RepID=UPI0033C6C15D